MQPDYPGNDLDQKEGATPPLISKSCNRSTWGYSLKTAKQIRKTLCPHPCSQHTQQWPSSHPTPPSDGASAPVPRPAIPELPSEPVSVPRAESGIPQDLVISCPTS